PDDEPAPLREAHASVPALRRRHAGQPLRDLDAPDAQLDVKRRSLLGELVRPHAPRALVPDGDGWSREGAHRRPYRLASRLSSSATIAASDVSPLIARSCSRSITARSRNRVKGTRSLPDASSL